MSQAVADAGAVLVLFTRQVSDNYPGRLKETLCAIGFSVKIQVTDTIESTLGIMHEEALAGVQFCIVLANKRHEENRTCNLNYLKRTSNRVDYHVRYRTAINRIWKAAKLNSRVPFPEEEHLTYEERNPSAQNNNNKRQHDDDNTTKRRYAREEQTKCQEEEYDPARPWITRQVVYPLLHQQRGLFEHQNQPIAAVVAEEPQSQQQRLNQLLTLLHQLQQVQPKQHFVPVSLLNRVV